MKTWHKLLLALALIVLPLAGRWAWYHRGAYTAPPMAEIDEAQIAPARPEYRLAEDKPQPGSGRVLIDLTHNNNLEINDLVPLQDRLRARGVTVDTLDAAAPEAGAGDPLTAQLRGATAMVILAPATAYTAAERQAIVDFVEDGGRLLLAADPTRPVPVLPEQESLFTLFFPTSSTPAVNSLAQAFGVVYFDDYLYNIENNEGNYRNVRFTHLNGESPLTQDLSTIVFFASHSLQSDGLALIQGDAETRSPARGDETELVTAALAADGQVLALGDVTFLTPPYHTVADNDRFLGRIADWLAGAVRQRDLEDFPYLYRRPVDLVQMSGDFLDPRLVANTHQLQETFDKAGLALTLSGTPDPAHDALMLGVFEDTSRVDKYLRPAGISVTVFITATEAARALAPASATPTATLVTGPAVPTVTPTQTTGGGTSTPTATPTVTPTPAPGTGSEAGDEQEKSVMAGEKGIITLQGLGAIQIEGTTLFVVDRSSPQTVVVALAETPQELSTSLEKLISGDLSGCVYNDPVMVCSTGLVQEETGGLNDGSEETNGSGPSLFILADDDGPGGNRTGVEEFRSILGSVYTVTVWSTSQDGIPTGADVAGYDAYIIDSGNYAYVMEDTETLAAFENVEKANVMFIGEQPLPNFEPSPVSLNDLEVADAAHPIAFGFEAGQVLSLLPSGSDVPTIVIPETPNLEEVQVVFKRGPGSPETGRPVVLTAVDSQKKGRIVLAGFAFYRLPEEARRTFALNAVKWLLEQP